MGSEGADIRILPMVRLRSPTSSAASLETTAKSPGASSPEATITRTVFPVSRLVRSTTVFRGKELVAT
ncbi:MAG: hypothetical protein FWG27_06600 [Treponema sp.]|nr:hypothetical protein [Treponema sp.]